MAALFAFVRSSFQSACLAFLRSQLSRRAGSPLPTMHSLRVPVAQEGHPPYGAFSTAAKRRPLRVVRSAPGRLVISGRMADVCAELERLAALEGDPGQSFAPAR